LRHPNTVSSAQYSPDGRRILTALGYSAPETEDPFFGAWIWDAEHDDLVLAAGAQNTAYKGVELALAGDINGATERFAEAQALNPYPDFDLETQARELAARELASKFVALVKDGHLESANEAMAGATLFDPSLEMTAFHWDLMCRYGSLWGRVEEVLGHCDQAISMEAKADYHDSRGIARALSGDYEGAIEDFLVFAKAYNSRVGRADEVAQRVEWIEGLEEGRNPLDEATLEALRNE
jgi:tetratricopeptide (TPR) repeat protein